MRRIISICSKDLKDYFYSPIAYIIISIFILITGWFFFSTFFIINQASLRDFFELLPITMSFIVPAITMKSFSEEFNIGSYEILVTFPVKLIHIILGKFLSICVFIMFMLIPTLFFPISISFVGKLDWGPIVCGYIGGFLLGISYGSIGIFASSLTKNQINSFIVGTLICLLLSLLDKLLFFMPETIITVANYLSSNFHFQNFSKGIFDLRDIVYFLSIIFVFLYATNISLSYRK
ncbi:ABC transporter permease subunit [Desulfothermus okinawensis JCM 13304]